MQEKQKPLRRRGFCYGGAGKGIDARRFALRLIGLPPSHPPIRQAHGRSPPAGKILFPDPLWFDSPYPKTQSPSRGGALCYGAGKGNRTPIHSLEGYYNKPLYDTRCI